MVHPPEVAETDDRDCSVPIICCRAHRQHLTYGRRADVSASQPGLHQFLDGPNPSSPTSPGCWTISATKMAARGWCGAALAIRSAGTTPWKIRSPPKARPGAALVFDGRLFHGTGANRTPAERAPCHPLYYVYRSRAQQQKNFFLGFTLRCWQKSRDEFLRRLRLLHLGRCSAAPIRRSDKGRLAAVSEPTGPLEARGKPIAC